MVQFNTTIQQFGEQGEKTGWTHIIVPAAIAQQLIPGNKKTFRVKGFLDDHKIEGVALLPMGGGDFVMPINATMRKGTKKRKGATITVKLSVDTKPVEPPAEFVECLKDEPRAYEYFYSLTKGHQNYFTKWIEAPKTEQTKTKRIAQAVNALAKKHGYAEMIRALKSERDDLMK